ncbi:uncharacterized protein LOC123514973 [Portunus trituberculatus]|uniref:uncharacterized protein LOC123514973 n=1 Tax=Portunus trituberculatus TaxID=210409 RepID=UPI001E1CBD9F|nr:uncharacterized protein LOC123514973 [Portunus trituberculatus]
MDEERFLCPVRALCHYLQRTASETRPRNLFVAVKRPSRPMSKAAISYFLRDTIKSAHEAISDSVCLEVNARAHDIRGIAASMLLWENCSVPTILKAARWRTHSVFADHYLRDIVRKEGDVFPGSSCCSRSHCGLTTTTRSSLLWGNASAPSGEHPSAHLHCSS